MSTNSLVRLKEIEKHPHYIHAKLLKSTAKNYQDEITRGNRALAVTLIALFVIGIVVFCLYASNHLLSLPQDFLQLFKNINYVHLAAVSGTLVVLISGASIIIHKARTQREDLLQANTAEKAPKRGAFSNMEKHLETVLLKNEKWDKNVSSSAYIDRSTLDKTHSGKAYLYYVKPCSNHYFVSVIVSFIGTPFYIIGTVAANVIRAVVIPLYVLVQCLRETVTNSQLYPMERKFCLSDAGKEFLRSIMGIIKAPFYGLAYFFAAFYSFIDPMGGRKLGASIERDWNEGANFADGYWSIGGPQTLWKRDGAWGPLGLKQKRFFLAGCWQPLGIVEYDKGEIKSSYRLVKPLDTLRGRQTKEIDYHLYRRSDLEAYVFASDKASEITNLIKEYNDLKKKLNTQKDK